MTRLYGWLVGTLLTRQTWTLELFLAVQSMTWGLWLLGPWDSFAVVPGAFTVLGLIPEPVWGTVFAAHGMVHCYAVLRENVGLCRRSVLTLACLWGFVFVSLLLTIPLATSTPIYGASILGCAWVFFRLSWRFG